jgi:hypothetical protein
MSICSRARLKLLQLRSLFIEDGRVRQSPIRLAAVAILACGYEV